MTTICPSCAELIESDEAHVGGSFTYLHPDGTAEMHWRCPHCRGHVVTVEAQEYSHD